MTTIAWDGTSLSADKQATDDAGHKRLVNKIHTAGEYIYAGCGDLIETIAIADWLRSGARKSKRPTFEEPVIGLVIVRATGVCIILNGKAPTFCPIHEPFFACGSGREYAFAAMSLGESSRKAVQVAHRFDAFTGAEVDTVRIGKATKRGK